MTNLHQRMLLDRRIELRSLRFYSPSRLFHSFWAVCHNLVMAKMGDPSITSHATCKQNLACLMWPQLGANPQWWDDKRFWVPEILAALTTWLQVSALWASEYHWNKHPTELPGQAKDPVIVTCLVLALCKVFLAADCVMFDWLFGFPVVRQYL